MYRRYYSQSVNALEDFEGSSEQLRHGSYGLLLFDKRWRSRRQEILEKDGSQCVVCYSGEELQVHHRQYHYYKTIKKFKAPWDYPDRLMITLCNKCHQKGHNLFKVPIIYI